MTFDPHAELATLRQHTALIRKPRYARSRLDRPRAEWLALRHAGATVAELQRWLRAHRINVVHSTVARWLTRQAGH